MNAAALLSVCVNSALQSALLVLIVGAILFACRRTNASTRHRVWFFTLIAAVVLPVVDILVHTSPPAGASSAAPGADYALTAFVVSPRIVDLALLAWAVLSAAFLVRLGWSFVRLERLRRATSAVSPELEAKVRSWAARLGITRPVAVRTAPELTTPIAIGIFDALIVIPEMLLETLAEDDIEYILVHELAHLRRRDDLTNLLAKLARAVFIFNPALIFIERKLALEREIACDDSVVATVGKARRYARCLAHVMLLSPPHAGAHGLPLFRSPEQSVHRIEMLLAPPKPARLILVNAALGGAMTAITVGLAVAASTPQFVAFDFPIARVLGVAQLDALRRDVFAPAATALATAAPRIDRALQNALTRTTVTVSYAAQAIATAAPVATRGIAPVQSNAQIRFASDEGRPIDGEAARTAALAQDAEASTDVGAAPAPKQPVHVSAVRFTVGTPITPARNPALALSYNSYVLAPMTAGAAVASVAGPKAGGGAGGSGSGSLDGVTLGGGGLGAPTQGGGSNTRGPVPGLRKPGP